MTALRVRIDRDSPVPPWEQLRAGVARRIARGRLLPGDRLPTVRSLAERLDLAPNTVARAYRALEDAGWLQGRGRNGTFVADAIPVPVDDAAAALASAADDYLRRAGQLGFSEPEARDALGTSVAAKKSSTAAPT
ncbi:MAG TPA: GntR family transcriptional regulator [Actinomycetota bacterium]|jgi:DNA-binding transcriptional regulator YhcF (GntR family)